MEEDRQRQELINKKNYAEKYINAAKIFESGEHTVYLDNPKVLVFHSAFDKYWKNGPKFGLYNGKDLLQVNILCIVICSNSNHQFDKLHITSAIVQNLF